jgi:hypothetical protein
VPLLLLPFLLAPTASGNGCPTPCSGQSTSPPDTKLVFVQPEGEGGPLIAYDTRTGAEAFALPPGRASANGRVYLAAFPGPRTQLTAYAVPTGRRIAAWTRPGRWTLAAVSPTGGWIALARRSAARTTVLVAESRRGRVAHVLRLRGDFEVETISADGRRLFLIEHLRDSRRYLVRLYDLAGERLAPMP